TPQRRLAQRPSSSIVDDGAYACKRPQTVPPRSESSSLVLRDGGGDVEFRRGPYVRLEHGTQGIISTGLVQFGQLLAQRFRWSLEQLPPTARRQCQPQPLVRALPLPAAGPEHVRVPLQAFQV